MLSAEIVATRKDGPVDHNTLDSCKLIVTFTETEEKDVDHVRARLAALKLVALEAVDRRPAGGNVDEDPRDDREPGDRGYREPDRRPDRRDDRPPAREERERDRGRRDERLPRTGRDFFGWSKDNGYFDQAVRIGMAWRLPGRMSDWTEADVADMLHELKTKTDRRGEPATNGAASNGRWGGGR